MGEIKKVMINNRVYKTNEDGTLEFVESVEKKKEESMVNSPLHYGGANNPYEAIKVIEAWEADFNIGSALKYLCRCGKKTIGGSSEEMRLEDLKKARWYIDREIYNIEHKSNNPYQE